MLSKLINISFPTSNISYHTISYLNDNDGDDDDGDSNGDGGDDDDDNGVILCDV